MAAADSGVADAGVLGGFARFNGDRDGIEAGEYGLVERIDPGGVAALTRFPGGRRAFVPLEELSLDPPEGIAAVLAGLDVRSAIMRGVMLRAAISDFATGLRAKAADSNAVVGPVYSALAESLEDIVDEADTLDLGRMAETLMDNAIDAALGKTATT